MRRKPQNQPKLKAQPPPHSHRKSNGFSNRKSGGSRHRHDICKMLSDNSHHTCALASLERVPPKTAPQSPHEGDLARQSKRHAVPFRGTLGCHHKHLLHTLYFPAFKKPTRTCQNHCYKPVYSFTLKFSCQHEKKGNKHGQVF